MRCTASFPNKLWSPVAALCESASTEPSISELNGPNGPLAQISPPIWGSCLDDLAQPEAEFTLVLGAADRVKEVVAATPGRTRRRSPHLARLCS
jgi:hypothetical protein